MRLGAVVILMVLLTCSSASRWSNVGKATTTTNEALIDSITNLIDSNTNQISSEKVSGVCYAEHQEEGKCVKKSMCDKIMPPEDPTKDFTYKEKSSIPPNDCGFLMTCCPLDKIRTDPVAPPRVTAPGCGYSNPALSVFRSGSEDSGYADFAEFPWMVALLKNGVPNWTSQNYIGGGALIHPSVVLTTAHKVDSSEPSDLKVRAGEWDTENENEDLPHQERVVEEIRVHEQFDRDHAQYDIALLFMVKPFDIQAHINEACLSRSLPAPGTVCYSMGWGLDFTRGKNYASVLKKITLPLMQKEECERRFRRSKLGPRYTLHRSLICAGGQPNVDMCIGDGGSPLVCPIGEQAERRYAVVGLVAYGLECGSAITPGAYASVPAAYEWLCKQLRIECVEARPYIARPYGY